MIRHDWLERNTEEAMESLSGKIVRSSFRNTPVSFFVESEADVIQRHHARGTFYEIEELSIIESFFPKSGIFLDIGTNVGNHTIFAAQHLHARQCLTIEANPAAISILKINLDLNKLNNRIDSSLLGLGLSDRNHTATVITPKNNNLGGSRLANSDDAGSIRCVKGDDVLLGRPIDFIKLDVEGMELSVLSGLDQVIKTNRPMIFAEIENRNLDAFQEFININNYVVKKTFQRYSNNENFMIIPVETSLI